MGPKKSKAELFLKLLKRVQRPEYTVHILENREGQKAMFYNYKGESFDEIIDNLLDRRESHKKQVIKKLSNLRDRAQPKKQLEQTKAYGQEKEIGETFA